MPKKFSELREKLSPERQKQNLAEAMEILITDLQAADEHIVEMERALFEMEGERNGYRKALQRIKDTEVPEIDPNSGPEDMHPDAKPYCAAFGACIVAAREALNV